MNKNEYARIHQWLAYNFGKANKCQFKKCENGSKKYEYSLISGKPYEKKRRNFWMLCRDCHRKYDDKYQKKINFKNSGWFTRELKNPVLLKVQIEHYDKSWITKQAQKRKLSLASLIRSYITYFRTK